MSIHVKLVDPSTGREAKVNESNAVAVAPPEYSSVFTAELGVADTAVNIVEAIANKKFIITAVVLTANKNVSNVVDATVSIYESTAAASAVVAKTIVDIPIAQSSNLVLTNLALEVSESVYINGVTDDDDVFVNLFGYYVDV